MEIATQQNKVTYFSKNRDSILKKQREKRKTEAYKIKQRVRDRARYARDKSRKTGKFHPSKIKLQSQKNTYYNIRSRLKKSFQISFADYKALLEKNGGLCNICGKPEIKKNQGLSVDHNHSSGKIRGLLCSNCNAGIGMFKDDPTTLKNAIEYLLLHQK